MWSVVRKEKDEYKKVKKKVRKCVVCGKEIVVVGNQITCSIECRKKRRKYMMRKYHQKYNEKNKEIILKNNGKSL